MCNGEMGWAKGDSAGLVGLFSQGPASSVDNLVSNRTDERKEETGAFFPSPTPPKQVVLCALGVPGTSLASSMPEAGCALAVLGSWKWTV